MKLEPDQRTDSLGDFMTTLIMNCCMSGKFSSGYAKKQGFLTSSNSYPLCLGWILEGTTSL